MSVCSKPNEIIKLTSLASKIMDYQKVVDGSTKCVGVFKEREMTSVWNTDNLVILKCLGDRLCSTLARIYVVSVAIDDQNW